MKDDSAAFISYMDRTWMNWRRQLNGVLCERIRQAFLAGAEAERKERDGKCAHAGTQIEKTGSSGLKRPSKASVSGKARRGK